MLKKNKFFRRVFAAIVIGVLLISYPALSASAAKEQFTTYEISGVAINGIDAPEAGKPFDFTAEENSQKYNIIKVAWQQQGSSKYITDPSSQAVTGLVYQVCIVLEVATPQHFFKTGEGRVSAVPNVTVNGQVAWADNTLDYDLFSIDASKYDFDTTYERYLRVWYTFPVVEGPEPIKSLAVNIDEPVAGELPATKAMISAVNSGENVGYINVDQIFWAYQNGNPLGSTSFEYGESYTAVLYLTALWPREFATDPNHPLASAGNPFTAVTATVNGKSATVLPEGNAASKITVSVVLKCEGIGKISEASVSVTPPQAGKSPDYQVGINSKKFSVADTNDRFTSGGVSWYNETDRKNMYVGVDKFEEGKVYTVTVELSASEGYEFPTSGLVAKIDNQTAETWGRDSSEAFISYTFAAVPKHTCSPEKVEEKKATCTENGKNAYYVCSICGKYFEDFQCTKEIANLDGWGEIKATEHTGGKATCVEKATCQICGAAYGELAAHAYGKNWDYTDTSGHAHKCTVSGCEAHDEIVQHKPGKSATSTEPQLCTVCKYVITPADTHKHKLTEVEKVSATCTKEGKKAYFYCESCGSKFTNSTATKKITDETTLVIPPTGHKESKWKTNSDEHWKVCTAKGCGVVIDGTKESHTFGAENTCTVCGYKKGDPVSESEPETSEEEGITEAPTTEPDTTADSNETTGLAPAEKNNTGLWSVVIISALVAASSVAVMAVILLKNKKKVGGEIDEAEVEED